MWKFQINMQIFDRQVKYHYKIQEKKKKKHLKSGQLSQAITMLKLDYKVFVLKMGTRLKPSQNTAINDALVSHNNS